MIMDVEIGFLLYLAGESLCGLHAHKSNQPSAQAADAQAAKNRKQKSRGSHGENSSVPSAFYRLYIIRKVFEGFSLIG